MIFQDFYPLDLALIHYPVKNNKGETIGSSITNLDIHDIARAGRTYGINNFYVVTPYRDQQRLASELISHWKTGYGGNKNQNRKEAFSLVEICDDISVLYKKVSEKWQKSPCILATCACDRGRTAIYGQVRRRLLEGEPHLILFGTAWGLADEVIAGVDFLLPPIRGRGEYNHLSVRSAASIILDRLLGVQDYEGSYDCSHCGRATSTSTADDAAWNKA